MDNHKDEVHVDSASDLLVELDSSVAQFCALRWNFSHQWELLQFDGGVLCVWFEHTLPPSESIG